MAIPNGAFDAVGTMGSGIGTYSYQAGAAYPHYFAGTFFIDTGYDDPVIWTTGVDAAEVYAARVYGASGSIGPSASPGTFAGDWRIEASPVWVAKFYVTPAPAGSTQARILIKCDVYLASPVSTAAGAYQILNSVNWSLYRI